MPEILHNSSFINGKWEEYPHLSRIDVYNPFNLELITQVPKCGEKECDTAILAAQKAFLSWKKISPRERSAYLKKLHKLICENTENLAALLTQEQGKPLKESKAEVVYAADYFEWFSEEARRIYGDIIPSPITEKSILVQKEAIGVVGIITPWNFPIAMIARKMAAALAAGCTMVIKPASQTPLSALALAALSQQAGIPDGVVNVITGDSEKIVQAFMSSEIVRKISFTGSTAVGQKLMRDSANTLKRITLELGGNAPLIVFDDANLDLAVSAAVKIKFRNSGQTCVCVNRFIIQESIIEKFQTNHSRL